MFIQDHLTSLLDALDSQTEACRDLIDLAFNLIAHGTNQAMQALTVVSVLFLPLTFLAGIYGEWKSAWLLLMLSLPVTSLLHLEYTSCSDLDCTADMNIYLMLCVHCRRTLTCFARVQV